MREQLLSTILGVITHFATTHQGEQGKLTNQNEQSGALTIQYAENYMLRIAMDRLINEALTFIHRGDAVPVSEPVVAPVVEAEPVGEPVNVAVVPDIIPSAPVSVESDGVTVSAPDPEPTAPEPDQV